MRVTFLSQSRELLFDLRRVQGRKQSATQEISSGLRVSKPSDSPAGASGIVRTNNDLAAIEQFRANIEAVQAELRAVDGALAQAGAALTRALTLAAQAANATQTPESRAAIRADLEGIFRHLVLVANTTHSNRFVFAGDAADTAPFVIDPSHPDGVSYQGDSARRAIAFPDGRPAQISLPGNEIFNRPDVALGSGRTPGTAGAVTPSPPLGVGIAFSGDVDAVISADLDGFFAASGPPGVPAGGETITVSFTSEDSSINTAISTPPLSGGEDASAIAALLNAEIAAHSQLAGGFTFSDEGGNLKLVESDTMGAGFSFTSSATGGLTTGLEPGGSVGGQSAEEIAAALNGQVAAQPVLSAARITFTAVNGEIQVDGDVDFSITVADFDRGSGFRSGLAGTHLVGGARSANIFGVLHQLIQDLEAGDEDAILSGVGGLQRAAGVMGQAHGFYGSTLRQIEITLDSLSELTVVNQQRLSGHRDADLLDSIRELTLNTSAEQFVLQVASRRQPNLLDFLA